MRAWLVHIVFAAILVGSLAARGRAPDVLTERGGLEPSVLRVARSQGLAFRGYTTIADTGRSALVFEAPGCTQPVRVVLRLLTFEEEPFAQLTPDQGYVRRYVYTDHTWDEPHRLAVWVQRIKYEVLAIFGQAQFFPSWHLIQIEAPTDCRVADTIDWRMVWNRDYLKAMSAADVDAVSGY
jgi:hypothetical protein